MAEKQTGSPLGSLSEDDIKQALRYNGFPLEIRLYKELRDAGLDPTIGNLFALPGDGEGEAETVEVDLIARFREPLAEHRGFVEINAVIEAKNYSEQVNFVGLAMPQDIKTTQVARLRIAGLPTCRVLNGPLHGHDLSELMLGPQKLADALDILNTPPFCVNWVKARAHPKGGGLKPPPYPVITEKDKDDWQSFKRLARVTAHLERDASFWLTRAFEGGPQLRLILYVPTIIIGTDRLYLYDALKNELSPTQSLVFQENIHADGEIIHRYFDVVSAGALPELITRYRATVTALRDACDTHLHELIEIAKRQQAIRRESTSERRYKTTRRAPGS